MNRAQVSSRKVLRNVNKEKELTHWIYCGLTTSHNDPGPLQKSITNWDLHRMQMSSVVTQVKISYPIKLCLSELVSGVT